MWCYSSTVIGLFGSLFIFGMVVGGILTKVLADKIGRLPTTIIGFICLFVLIGTLNLVPVLWVRLTCMFLIGSCYFCIFTCYMLMMELFP